MEVQYEKQNKESDYSYDQEVEIHSGFYKGRTGIIKSYNEKTGIYSIEIIITQNNIARKILIESKKDFIMKKKKFFGWPERK